MMVLRRPYFALALLTFVAGSASTLYLYEVAHHSSALNARYYPAPLTTVAIDNAVIAQNLLQHGVFSQSTTTPTVPDARRTPGMPAISFLSLWLFRSFYPVLILQLITLFATAVLLYRIGQRYLDNSWALVLAALYIVLPDSLLSVGVLYTENFFVFLFTLALYAFLYAEVKNVYLRFAATGALLAFATYVRPASLYLLIFLVPAYFFLVLRPREWQWKQFGAMALLVVVFSALLAPWYWRNYHDFGVIAFESLGSYDLFRQNGAQFYQSLTGLNAVDARAALERMAGIPVGPVPFDIKYNKVMEHTALAVIFSHPFKYAIFQATSLIPFFTSAGAHDYWRFVMDLTPGFNPPDEPSLIQALNPFNFHLLVIDLENHGWFLLENVCWGVVTLLMLISLCVGRERRIRGFFFVLIFYFALVTGPIAHARYRIPAEPLILLLAFSGAFELHERRLTTRSSLQG